MPKTIEPQEYGIPDDENPEWTPEMFARARRLKDMPEEFQAAVRRMQSGTAHNDQKQMTGIPLAADIVDALKATGPDWQKRAEDALREKFVTKAA